MVHDAAMRGWGRVDTAFAAIIAAAITGLFFLDISEPRGVVDGVGYAAAVSLAGRFGQRPLIGVAAFTTLLTILAAGLLPDAGISVGWMWANRLFAIAEIWIVALVIQHGLGLGAKLARRDANLRRRQAALSQIIREALPAPEERLTRLCELIADALNAEAAVLLRRKAEGEGSTVVAAWRRTPGKPFIPIGTHVPEVSERKAYLRAHQVVAADDVELSEQFAERRAMLRPMGLRAAMVAEVLQGAESCIVGVLHAEPHPWTDGEKSFGRSVASLIGLLSSTKRNTEILAALDQTKEGIFLEDRSGAVEYANKAGRRYLELAGGGSLSVLCARLHSEGQYDLRLGDRELDLRRMRLPNGGHIASVQDVTERNRLAAERERLMEQLHEAAKAEAVGQLASGMAHDFNNILGAVTGFASFIAQDTQQTPDNRDFVRRILSACHHGKELVAQIVSFADTRAVEFGTVNVGRAIQDCHDIFAAGLRPGTNLSLQAPPEPLLALGNQVQISQLINNLVANALDAVAGMNGGEIALSTRLATDGDIAAFHHPLSAGCAHGFGELVPGRAYVLLTVVDNGKGIEKDRLERIFEPFYSSKARQRGTGLGLAVVQGVVRSHQGACQVVSANPGGTSFSVFLPCQDPEPRAKGKRNSSINPCRVMIVDDEADMADMLSIGLERLGYHTVAVHNPFVALAAIEEEPAAFDALLTDQLMPGLNGTDLIREVKKVAPHIRAILCTGNAEKMREADALALGAETILYKPVEIDVVAAALSHLDPVTPVPA